MGRRPNSKSCARPSADGYGERIDCRSLVTLRNEAYRAGDLERAAQLSRKLNVHLGPQALRELPGETASFVQEKAERVEKENAALAEERDGPAKALKERIAWLRQGVEEVGKAIIAMKDRINNRYKYMTTGEIIQESIERQGRLTGTWETRNWVGRGHEPEHERDRDVGPSR